MKLLHKVLEQRLYTTQNSNSGIISINICEINPGHNVGAVLTWSSVCLSACLGLCPPKHSIPLEAIVFTQANPHVYHV